MGAIAGIIYQDLYQASRMIDPMAGVLSQRGQRERTFHFFKNMELAAIGQPMAKNTSGTIAAGIDGYILNRDELKAELQHQGHRLYEDSDAQLLVCAYECFGEGFLKMIDGAFTLFVFDERNESLLIARDRIGNKPLYWYHDHQYFLFSSSIKGLLASGIVPPTPSIDAFAVYLTLGYFPQDFSPIDQVSKLLPSFKISVKLNQNKKIDSYWSFSSYFQNQKKEPIEYITTQLDQLLKRSMQLHLRGQSSVGSVVSGGLGSASVAYYLNKCADLKNLTAYTAGFINDSQHDIEIAEEVSDLLHIPHRLSLLSRDNFLDELVKIVWHLDEPIADPNILATWQLGRMVGKDHENVFSGMGSDELLAGHLRYTSVEREKSYQLYLREWMHPLLRAFLIPFFKRIHPTWAFRFLKESKVNPWQSEFLQANTLFQPSELEAVSAPLKGMFDSEVFLHKFHHLSRVKSTTSSFLYFDVKTRLPECFMMQYERLMTANGLTWHAPFLDRRTVEFLAAIPEPDNLKEREAAVYLKSLLRGHLPDAIIDRPKRTRKEFLRAWVESEPMLASLKLLKKGALANNGLLSPQWLDEKLISPASRYVAFPQLFAVLVWEIWFRLFINRPIRPRVPDLPVKDLLAE